MIISNKLVKSDSIAINIVIAIGGSLLLALLARLSLPVPFSPVPITGQTFGVLLLGGLLGSRLAALSIFLYLIEGMIGLPVFAGGSLGLLYLFGPTGGYLIGFIPAAFLIGYLIENGWNKKFSLIIASMTIGTTVIFLFGVSWLTLTAGINTSIKIGLIPYLPGTAIKIALVSIFIHTLNRLSKQ